MLQLNSPDGDYTLGEPFSDLLVGITSFGESAGGPFRPGVYTRIAYFRDWIDCVIEGNVCGVFLHLSYAVFLHYTPSS